MFEARIGKWRNRLQRGCPARGVELQCGAGESAAGFMMFASPRLMVFEAGSLYTRGQVNHVDASAALAVSQALLGGLRSSRAVRRFLTKQHALLALAPEMEALVNLSGSILTMKPSDAAPFLVDARCKRTPMSLLRQAVAQIARNMAIAPLTVDST